MTTDAGYHAVFPPSYLDELESYNKDLSLAEWVKSENFADFSGFDALNVTGPRIIQDISLLKLANITGSLGRCLSLESSTVLAERWGQSSEWSKHVAKEDMLQLVARVCVLAFAGEELAHDQRWIDISTTYVENAFSAAAELRRWPLLLRPIANRLLAAPQLLRAQIHDARQILDPIISRRRSQRQDAQHQGSPWPPTGKEVALDWFDDQMRRHDAKIDPVVAQLALGFASISQTSDLLTQVMFNICRHPYIIPKVREEASRVLREHGWSKDMLGHLVLLDSVCKETQRLHTDQLIMKRLSVRPIDLRDGTHIPSGVSLCVDARQFTDESVYPSPSEFQPWRFHELRKQDVARWGGKGQFAVTSREMPAFGFGRQACPGRAFASNVIKLILLNIVLKYDFRIEDEESTDTIMFRSFSTAHPSAKIELRARQVDGDLQRILSGKL